MRKLLALAALMLSISAPATGAGPNPPLSYCPTCGGGSQFNQMPFYGSTGNFMTPSFFPSNYPWWAGYGAMSYSNFYYPGAWTGKGFDGAMYPGQGRGFMGKPNIYVTGPAGTQVKVRVELAPDSQMLVAIPSHGTEGWSATITENGRLNVQGVEYEYLYFDYRFDEKKLQDSAGFCTERESLIPKMSDRLKSAGFTEAEIRDFQEYWTVKIPPADRYCVFPQDARALDRVAKLVIEPRPTSVTRLDFLIVLDETFSLGRATSFRRTPKRDIEYSAAQGKPKDRAPASASGITVREWGVGFLQGR